MIRVVPAARAALSVLFLSFGTFTGSARAEIPTVVKAEIEHLVSYVGGSGCEFYRNGSWYDGRQGAEHLQTKLNWLAGRNMIQATQDFIEKAATQSSLSNLAYKVRCNGGEPIASAKWLSDELLRFRAIAKKPVS